MIITIRIQIGKKTLGFRNMQEKLKKDMSHWLQNHEVQNTNKIDVNRYIFKFINTFCFVD